MAESVIKRHPWRFAFALFAALVLMRIIAVTFPLTMPGTPQLEKRTHEFIQTHSERNRWILTQVEKQPDAPYAGAIKSEIQKAEALGASILANYKDSDKHAEVKRDIEQYMKHQCFISQRFGSSMNRSRLWINASYSRDTYNKTVNEETTFVRKMFGGASTAPACN